jgi:hypothetical protein
MVFDRASKGFTRRFLGLRPMLLAAAIIMLSFGFFWMNDVAQSRDELIVTNEAAIKGDIEGWEGMQDPSYIEVLIEDPAKGEMILHLPSVIEIRRTELHEDSQYHTTGY